MPVDATARLAVAAALSAAALLAVDVTESRASGARTRRPVPILMYHVIDAPPASAPFPDLYVSRRELAEQMSWLDAAGYEAVTLQRVIDAWNGRATLPSQPVVLTFDDGYRSHATAALPVLAAHRWPGVLNLDVSNLGPSWGLRVRDVRALIAAGWEIGAHSLTHPDLTRLDDAALRHEVAGSRAAIQRLFGVRVRTFCYPSGRHDARVVEAVRAAGFEAATTTQPGIASPGSPLRLQRVRIRRGDGAAGLARTFARLGLPTAVSDGLAMRE